MEERRRVDFFGNYLGKTGDFISSFRDADGIFNLENCDISNLMDVPKSWSFENANLKNCTINNCVFDGNNFDRANFTGAKILNTLFKGCTFDGAIFYETEFIMRVTFEDNQQKPDINHVRQIEILEGANLSGVEPLRVKQFLEGKQHAEPGNPTLKGGIKRRTKRRNRRTKRRNRRTNRRNRRQ